MVPEVDVVQVEIEDLFLGELALEPSRQQRLADLPLDGLGGRFLVALGGDEHGLGGLLGEGGTALHLALAGDLLEHGLEHRAAGADDVDAEVIEEVGVFGGDEGLHQALGNALVRHHLAALVVELAGEHPVDREDLGEDGRPVRIDLGDVGQPV